MKITSGKWNDEEVVVGEVDEDVADRPEVFMAIYWQRDRLDDRAVVYLTPAEAREIAAELLAAADKSEAGKP